MPSDTSEKGIESIIVASLIGEAGCQQGDARDYDREHAIDLTKLIAVIQDTQPKTFDSLMLAQDNPRRAKILNRLQGEMVKRGVIDVLRIASALSMCTLKVQSVARVFRPCPQLVDVSGCADDDARVPCPCVP